MLDKKYNHTEVEKNKYEEWMEKGYFKSGDFSKKPYCIILPPPNVTGKLAFRTCLGCNITRYYD